jgi:hypothetical protein
MQKIGRQADGKIVEETLLVERLAGREVIGNGLADEEDESVLRLGEKLVEGGEIHLCGLHLRFGGAEIEFGSDASLETPLI